MIPIAVTQSRWYTVSTVSHYYYHHHYYNKKKMEKYFFCSKLGCWGISTGQFPNTKGDFLGTFLKGVNPTEILDIDG